MIGDSTDLEGPSTHGVHSSGKVAVEPIDPLLLDEWRPALRGEDNVVDQVRIGGGHRPVGLWHPSGVHSSRVCFPGVALRFTPGYPVLTPSGWGHRTMRP